ncbi:MAG: hypothetical protein A2017_02735 [Lentisphaerae bacterium GWF2_44_16]|nr:MAG: hypothetical protein A2017_02735 [Lentisphaerae bacterium GWF2_44_16]
MNSIEGTNGYLEEAMKGTLDWLEAVRCKDYSWGRWKYSSVMIRPYGLIPSIIAIRVLAVLDKLNDIPQRLKQEAVKYFQSQQDASDGFFKDKLVGEKELAENHHHTWPDIWGQMDAKDALDLLGAKPLYPMPSDVFVDLASPEMEEEILSWNWQRPWLVGERFFRAVEAFFIRNGKRITPPIEKAFEIIEKEVFSESDGMPSKKGCSDINNHCGGVFKLMVTYKLVGRPYPFPERAIDSLLAMQKTNAEFADGGMCMNWDAIWVLWLMDKQSKSKYRHNDIAVAADKLAAMLMKDYRKADGAFAFGGKLCLGVHHSVRIGQALPISDMLGTLMCLYCLAYADDLNGKLNISSNPHVDKLIFMK